MPVWSPGAIGVDIFFVISGYLITALLARDLEERRFSLLSFYDRRVRRIVPAYAAVALVVSNERTGWLASTSAATRSSIRAICSGVTAS